MQKGNTKSIERFASISLDDGKKPRCSGYSTDKDIQIARNRVALREIVFRLIDHDRYHGLLAFYHSEDASQTEYRFSCLSVVKQLLTRTEILPLKALIPNDLHTFLEKMKVQELSRKD